MKTDLFDIRGRVAVVTGGYGVLGGSAADVLAAHGAKVAVLGRNRDAAEQKAEALRAGGSAAMALVADALEEEQLRRAADEVLAQWGRLDILVNAAGGNVARARTDDVPVFRLPFDAFDEVVRLNLHASVYPTLVFGEAMAERKKGSVVNISSMAATRAISGVLGYSGAKAAIDAVTRWLAVDLASRYGDEMRVNAIAPGFFVADQNRAVLVNSDGSFSDRANMIVERTPLGRLGDPRELQGTFLWLCSDASAFVTGAVIPVDGGFSAFSGV